MRVLRELKRSDTARMQERWEKRYGSLASLGQKVLINKCADPSMLSDYVLWKHISQGAEFADITVVESPDIFEVLTPRRVELLQHIVSHGAGSIKSLAADLHRDYKNVYDDVRALAEYGLVELVPAGRSLVPTSAATRLEVIFDA